MSLKSTIFRVIGAELIQVIGHANILTPRGDSKAIHGDILYTVEEIAKVVIDGIETEKTLGAHRFVVPQPLAQALNLMVPTAPVDDVSSGESSSGENPASSSPSPGSDSGLDFGGLQ